MTAPTALQQQILDVFGGDELTAQEIADRIRDRTVSMQLVKMGQLHLALAAFELDGTLDADWRWPETDHRPRVRVRVYRKAAP